MRTTGPEARRKLKPEKGNTGFTGTQIQSGTPRHPWCGPCPLSCVSQHTSPSGSTSPGLCLFKYSLGAASVNSGIGGPWNGPRCFLPTVSDRPEKAANKPTPAFIFPLDPFPSLTYFFPCPHLSTNNKIILVTLSMALPVWVIVGEVRTCLVLQPIWDHFQKARPFLHLMK